MKKDEVVYKKILDILKITPSEMVHVGDSMKYDYEIPTKLGIKAFIIDRQGKEEGEQVIRSLYELSQILK
ncbi:MAG: hypothetical protein ABIF10_08425 [Candidatus Woesearchaeota archaeon]